MVDQRLQVALSLIQAAQLAKAPGTPGPSAPGVVQAPPKLYPFPDPVQVKTVAASSTDDVWKYRIPAGLDGYVTYLGNSRGPKTNIYVYVDGRNRFVGGIPMDFADPNAPRKIEPWWDWHVSDELVFKYQNNSTRSQVYMVRCEGFTVAEADLSLLYKYLGG